MRKTRNEIYQKITEFLKKNNQPVKIQDIAKNTGFRWETVKNVLETLQAGNFIEKQDDTYRLNHVEEQRDTLLNIKIDKEDEKQIAQIANRFKEFNITKKTFLQKMVVELIKRENLNLPYGWYLFGQCTLLKLNDTDRYKSTKKYDKTIKDIIADYNYSDTNALMEDHYRKNKRNDYLTKLLIHETLNKEISDKTQLEFIDTQLKSLIWSIEQNDEDIDILKLLEDFYSIFVRLKKLSLDKINSIRPTIFSAFQTIWEMFGAYFLYKSLNKYNAKKEYEQKKLTLKENAEFYLDTLSDYCPTKELSEKTKKLKDSLV